MIHPFESKKATKQYDTDKRLLIKKAKSHDKALSKMAGKGNVLKGKNIEGKKGNLTDAEIQKKLNKVGPRIHHTPSEALVKWVKNR